MDLVSSKADLPGRARSDEAQAGWTRRSIAATQYLVRHYREWAPAASRARPAMADLGLDRVTGGGPSRHGGPDVNPQPWSATCCHGQ